MAGGGVRIRNANQALLIIQGLRQQRQKIAGGQGPGRCDCKSVQRLTRLPRCPSSRSLRRGFLAVTDFGWADLSKDLGVECGWDRACCDGSSQVKGAQQAEDRHVFLRAAIHTVIQLRMKICYRLGKLSTHFVVRHWRMAAQHLCSSQGWIPDVESVCCARRLAWLYKGCLILTGAPG